MKVNHVHSISMWRALVNFQILTQPCISGINHFWPWSVILLKDTLLNSICCYFVKDFCIWFCILVCNSAVFFFFLVTSLSDFVFTVIQASRNKWGIVLSALSSKEFVKVIFLPCGRLRETVWAWRLLYGQAINYNANVFMMSVYSCMSIHVFYFSFC